MASDDKKTKTIPVPKAEPAPAKADASPAKDKSPSTADKAKSTGAEAAPSSYSRGEGQKPVSQAYKDNWNAIYGKKPKKSKKKKQ
jgi:hypothetical protein